MQGAVGIGDIDGIQSPRVVTMQDNTTLKEKALCIISDMPLDVGAGKYWICIAGALSENGA